MMRTWVIALSVFIGVIAAFPFGIKVNVKDEWSDAYIDEIMANLQQVILANNLDPLDLPGDGFDIGIASGSVYNGRLMGLSTIHRSGPTSFDLVDSTKAKLTGHISVDNLRAHYDAKASITFVTVHAKADAKIDTVKVYLDAEMGLTPGSTLQLVDFRVEEIGHISIDVSGLGPIDFILEGLVDLIGNLIRGFIGDWISGPLKDLIQGILDDMVPPIPSMSPPVAALENKNSFMK